MLSRLTLQSAWLVRRAPLYTSSAFLYGCPTRPLTCHTTCCSINKAASQTARAHWPCVLLVVCVTNSWFAVRHLEGLLQHSWPGSTCPVPVFSASARPAFMRGMIQDFVCVFPCQAHRLSGACVSQMAFLSCPSPLLAIRILGPALVCHVLSCVFWLSDGVLRHGAH